MAAEMTDNIIIPIAPSDGEAAARNTTTVINLVRSTSGKMYRWVLSKASKVRAAAPQPQEAVPPAAAAAPINQGNSGASTDEIKPRSCVQRRNPIRTPSLHPIIIMVQEHELGKLVFNLAAPLTVGLIITSGGKSLTLLGNFVLIGLSVGCELIFTGIQLRTTFPKPASVMEHAGITMVIISFNGLVAAALPPDLAWVPMVCGCFCVLPLVIATFHHDDGD